MNGRLAGKCALVTGAASGIGKAVALRFAREGALVGFADRDGSGASTAVSELGGGHHGIALEVDVADERSVDQAYATLGSVQPIDVVVANAGVQLFGQDARVGDLDIEVWARTIDVNLTGTYLTVKHAVRSMMRRGGSIIITGSPTGVTGGGRGFTAYSSSKAGIHGLARVVAADYAGEGIRVNVVIPGYTETPLVRTIADDESARATLLATVPLGRAGAPHDIEGVMVYLASDESSYATGALFTVDGGATAI